MHSATRLSRFLALRACHITTLPLRLQLMRTGLHRKKQRMLENLGGSDVELTAADMGEIAGILETNPVHGHRYFGPEVDTMLWQ